MKVHIIKCNCGAVPIELTNIQFEDFDCGMMGSFNCPSCNIKMLPTSEKPNFTNIIEERPGEDPGWC